MPLSVIDGPTAVRNLRNNRYATWPERTDPDERLGEICRPQFAPGFNLVHGEHVFTIGSCFARNIENALMAHGFSVPAAQLKAPDGAFARARIRLLNNFGVPSIANELRWALDPSYPFSAENNFFELTPGRYVDIHLSQLWPMDLEGLTRCREAALNANRSAKYCRVVVMTLGLSECWYDRTAGIYLNMAPPRSLVSNLPDRFELHVLSFDETLAWLRIALDTLKRFCRADQRVLLTVSPVPLAATYTGEDVLVANSYSKSVLRAAAGHVAAEFDHIDYFPSYESVMLSDRGKAWMEDQRHVRSALVDYNVERMIEAYRPDAVPAKALDITARLADVEEALEARLLDQAVAILEPIRDQLYSDVKATLTYADLCLRMKRPQDAAAALEALGPDKQTVRVRILQARIEADKGHIDAAAVALMALKVTPRARPLVLKALSDIYFYAGAYKKALSATLAWSKVVGPAASEPLRRLAVMHAARGHLAQAEAAYRAAVGRPNPPAYLLLDYAEFLLLHGRFSEGRDLLQSVQLERGSLKARREALMLYTPSADETGEATETVSMLGRGCPDLSGGSG